MGNTPDSKPLIEKCLEKEQLVDASMVNLACSLDTLYASKNLVIDHFQCKESSTQGDISHSAAEYQLLAQQFIATTVLHNKDHAMKSLCNFLHCIRKLFHLLSGPDVIECQNLALDTYLSNSKDFETTMYIAMEELVKENKRMQLYVECLEKKRKEFHK